MHSRFRISNSSDRHGLDLGVAGLQRVPPVPGEKEKERKGHSTEELRLYLEPRLHCSKLLPQAEEAASKDDGDSSAWLRVEPHHVVLSATLITPELLASEEKQRQREAARKAEAEEADWTKQENDVKAPITNGDPPAMRRKTMGQGKSSRPSGRVEGEKSRKSLGEGGEKSRKNQGEGGEKSRKSVAEGGEKSRKGEGGEKRKREKGGLPPRPPNPLAPCRPPSHQQVPARPPTVPQQQTHLLPQMHNLPQHPNMPMMPMMPNMPMMPQLPTSPIPMGDLPPSSIRSPPPLPSLRSPPPLPSLLSPPPFPALSPSSITPFLSSLKPIPPKLQTPSSLQTPSPLQTPSRLQTPSSLQTPSPLQTSSQQTSSPLAQSHLISIQVPMAGPDGTQTLQTINVPRSVLAGASDRPILLTVTPKNGINKGQKQIVVLTKNSATGSTTAGLARPSQQGHLQGSPRPQQGQLQGSPRPPNSQLHGSPRPPHIQLQGSPRPPQGQLLGSPRPPQGSPQLTGPPQGSPQLARPPQATVQGPPSPSKAVHLSPRPGAQQAAGAQASIPQLVVRQGQVQGSPRATQPQPGPQTVIRTAGAPAAAVGPQTQPAVRPVGPLVQAPAPRPPVVPAVARSAAGAAVGGGAPRNQGPQVLRGQLIQTPQGQVLVQGDRRILLGPNSVVQGGKLVLTGAQMAQLTGAAAPAARPVQGGPTVRQSVVQGPRPVQGVVQGQAVQGARTVQGARVQGVTPVTQGVQGVTQQGVLQGVRPHGQAVQGPRTVQGITQQGQLVQGSTQQGQLVQGSTQQGQLVQGSTQQGQLVQGSTQQGQLVQGSTQQGQLVTQQGQLVNQQGQLQGSTQQGQLVQRLVQGQQVQGPSAGVVPTQQQIQTVIRQQTLQGPRLVLGGPPGASNGQTGGAPSTIPSEAGPGAQASLSRILAALHNRGLVSQQNGKFYYVGDKGGLSAGAVQGLGAGAGLKLANSPQGAGQQQQVIVQGSGLSMDSITASPHMLKMASSLLLGGAGGAEQPGGLSTPSSPSSNGAPPPSGSPLKLPLLPSSPLPHSMAHSSPLPHSLTPSSPLPQASTPSSPLKLEGAKQTFYYRDPALPVGWYIRVDRTQVGEHRYQVETAYFSPDGALLRSQSEVAGYLGGRLIARDKSHRPPVSVSRLPWKDDLIATNKLFVPNLDNLANIVGTTLSSLGASLQHSPVAKRPNMEASDSQGPEKRPCPEAQPGALPLPFSL